MTRIPFICQRPLWPALAACVLIGAAMPAQAQNTVTANFTGKIRASTCVIPNPILTVPLGTHGVNDFAAAIGATVREADFKVSIQCPNTDIQVLVTPQARNVIDAANGVIGVDGGATGVGIQVLNAQLQPLTFGVAVDHGRGHLPTWQIQYYARYYRIAPTIGFGDANGSMTFAIEYR